MKQFAIILATALLGVLAALLLYDHFVVQPRGGAGAAPLLARLQGMTMLPFPAAIA